MVETVLQRWVLAIEDIDRKKILRSINTLYNGEQRTCC